MSLRINHMYSDNGEPKLLITEKGMKVDTQRAAKEPFSGSANVTKTFSQSMNGFVISNDGSGDLTFTIGTDTYTVKAGEVFEENFDPFTAVTVTTTVAFRAYGRG